MLIKPCSLSRAWKYWGIPLEIYYLYTSNYYTEYALCLLQFTDFNCGITNIKKIKPHCLSMNHLICKQWSKIKSSIVDINNCLNKVSPSFNKLHKELSSGFCLVDNFSNHFSFHIVNYKDSDVWNDHQNKLNNIFDKSLSNLKTVLVISDASIKNNIATSISYICNSWNIFSKKIYYTMNITISEAEFFSIRCGINQAVQIPNAEHIIIITDTIPTVRHIFNLSFHPFQLHSIAISQDLRAFFNKNSNNSINF